MRILSALVAATSVSLVGCSKHSTGGGDSPVATANSGSAALPHRSEVVRIADEIAVRASTATGAEATELAVRAATWRERVWRMDRRETDAREALELLEGAALGPGAEACRAAVEAGLLRGELDADPNVAYRAAYAARSRHGSACGDRAEHVLATLAAFRPPAAELEAIGSAAPSGSGPPNHPASAASAVGAIAVASPGGRALATGPTRITQVERYGAKEAARVVVFLTRPAQFQVGYLARESPTRGPRFYVDIAEASYRGPATIDMEGVVETVRLGQSKSGTRVVLDLAEDLYRRVVYLPEPFRLVIDVSRHAPRPPSGQPGARKVQRVVLDAGHGGHDPGAIGPSGLREKDATLDIALRAAPLIAREIGISTLLTRDRDDYVPLDERTARANAFNADLFVSIHCNASEDDVARGVMTFILDESKDPLAAHVAARENAASAAAGAELATAMNHVIDAGTRSASLEFAELLQRATVASLIPKYADTPDQGVKRAGFYVLAGAHMPAVLFEASFVSHPIEEARLDTGDYRQKMADAIVNAIRAYRQGL